MGLPTPRPRKDDPQSAAPAKIEATFWRLLEEVGYSEITVRRISQTAGTNRNSFYYHYDSLEDLARKAFLNNAEGARPLISSLIAGLRGSVEAAAHQGNGLVAHAERVMLCARSESPFLKHMVNELLRNAWFDELGIDGTRLSEDDWAQVEFIFAGLVAVLGSNAVAKSPIIMTHLAEGRVGQACITALRQIAEAQSASSTSAQLGNRGVLA